MDLSNAIFVAPRHALAPLRPIAKFSWLLIIVASMAVTAPVVDAQTIPILSVRPEVPFALADFDGDQRLDLAIVQAGRSELSFMEYWVHLQLSATGAHTIRVVGLAGGVQLASRDINNDRVPDLILTTARSDKPVAIFLNDGHGNFSSLDLSAYPEAFSASSTDWTSSAFPEYGLLTLPSKSPCGACPAAIQLPVVDSSRRAARRSIGFLLNQNSAPHLGRSPPSDLPLL